MELNSEYWNERYRQNSTPWDIGYVSPPLKELIDSIDFKGVKVLIPGAGKAYEAIYLHQNGFTNVYVCDWAPESFDHLRREVPDFPADHLLVKDFFELEDQYNLILEQTFFCSIRPARRVDYVKKVHSLLVEGGELAGLLFATTFSREGPPFGGTKREYSEHFAPFFVIKQMEIARNSILPRSGSEYFFRMKKG